MKTTVLLAGVGALAYYIYNRMDEEQKQSIVQGVKDQLNKTIEQIMPRNSRANFETRVDNITNSNSVGEGSL
jgi:uncharacterized membrane protein YebE (DUF533 family)